MLGLETLAFAQVWLAGCLAESCLAPALQYFVMNGLASVTVIIGLFSAYAATGSLVLCGWNAVSSLMIASGVLLKLYVAPVHVWIGQRYAGAAVEVAGFSGACAHVVDAGSLACVRLHSHGWMDIRG